MKINIYSIEKTQNPHIKDLIDEYVKMSSRYAAIEDFSLFDKKIARLKNPTEAKRAYTALFKPYLKGLNISLDVTGKELDSFEFAKMLENETRINFFIGGAYGFEKDFLKKTQRVVSLSRLTYAHKIAKVVLYEQIYRGLSILNNHPYHK